MLTEFGAAGYGLFWRIVEILHSEKTHKIPHKKYVYLTLAKQMLTSVEQIETFVEQCINVYELFESDGECFWSNRVMQNIGKRNEIKEKRANAGKISAERRKLANNAPEISTHVEHNLTHVEQISTNFNKGKERKEKEIKEKKSINKEEKEINKEKLVEEKNILLDWLGSNCPRVQKMKQPITFQQAEALLKDYEHELQIMKDVFLDMENYTDLNKKTSANLTIRKWIGLAKERKKGLFNQPKIDRLVWNERKS
jgi:hypothetical protein